MNWKATGDGIVPASSATLSTAALMIPTGHKSGMRESAERDVLTSAVRQMVRIVATLSDIAQSERPPAEKLELLTLQIGTLQFFADQLAGCANAPTAVPAPHFDRVEREDLDSGILADAPLSSRG